MAWESDADDKAIVLNSSKQVTLQDWGWEGTLEDAFDTGSTAAINTGGWELREDVKGQQDELVRLEFKKERAESATHRRALAKTFLQLLDRKPKLREQAARRIGESADRGDLAALFWMEQTLRSEQNDKVFVLVGVAAESGDANWNLVYGRFS